MYDDVSLTTVVRDAAAGSQDAWNSLVARFAPLVLSIARGHRMAEKDVEDVCQTLWLRLVEHLASIREPQALPMWIITTTRNECVRCLRSSRRTEPYDPLAEHSLADVAEGGDLDEELLRAERSAALLQAFAELSDQQRAFLLLLAEDPPLSYRDIGERLAMPIGSIGPTRARLLQKLRECPSIAALVAGHPVGAREGNRT